MRKEDLTSEAEVISHALNTGETLGLDESYFSNWQHVEIWKAICTLAKKGKAINVGDVLAILKAKKKPVSPTMLASLVDALPVNANLEIRLKSLREKKSVRELININNIVMSKLNDPVLTPEEIAEWAIEHYKEIHRVNSDGLSLTQEIRDIIAVTNGDISVTELAQSVTRRDTPRNTIRKALTRLAKEGLIEPTQRGGVYRVVNKSIDEIDFMNVTDTEINFSWPLQVEQFFKLMPKNIVIIAGEPDSGKTAFLLNVAALNMKDSKVKYFSSEMGALELRSRLEQWQFIDDERPLRLEDWANDNFRVYERIMDFHDVIEPDAINIIDFLEIHNEFYRISEYIRQIFDKLTTGVAIIAIQKNRGAEWGLGGQRTIEKARLAINLNNEEHYHTAQLVKVKNWRNPQHNPHYMKIKYSLSRGCYFKPISSWSRETPEQAKEKQYEQSSFNGPFRKGTRNQLHTERDSETDWHNRY